MAYIQSRFTQLLVLLVTTFIHYTNAQEEDPGFKSAVFDPKYIPFQELLITPKTHPGLFSFTGRWHRRRERYTASSWPGTYLTSLIYGNTCIIKLRPEHIGNISDYSFYISVDGTEDFLYTLPPFDSLDPNREVIYVPVTLPQESEEPGPQVSKVLKPHTVRITSNAETPFSFEGYLVENTLIKQGLVWSARQDDRVLVEFVGEGVSSEYEGGLLGWISNTTETDVGMPPDIHMVARQPKSLQFIHSIQSQVSNLMGIRHIHISSDVCLVSDCDPMHPLPGLAQQYFHEDPIVPPFRLEAFRRGDKQQRKSLQQEWQFFAEKPWVKTATPNYVVVDLGVRDILLSNNVSITEYGRALMLFLGKLRVRARPNALIIVVGRDYSKTWTIPHEDSIIPDTKESQELRKQLFATTKQAVEAVQLEDPYLVFYPIIPTPDPKYDLALALCQSVIPPLIKHENMTRPQRYCSTLSSLRTAESSDSIVRSQPWYFVGLLMSFSGLVYLLRQPIMLVLGKVRTGQRKVYGVRDMEGGVGVWRGTKAKLSTDEDFVMLGGGNGNGNRWKGTVDKKG